MVDDSPERTEPDDFEYPDDMLIGGLAEDRLDSLASASLSTPHAKAIAEQSADRISARDERRLIKRARTGDRAAVEELIEAHRRLVGFWARRYAGRGVPGEDLHQEGVLGLIDAIARFDLDRSVRFATYAGWWVRQYQARAVEKQGDGLPLTAHQRRQRAMVRSAVAAFEQSNGQSPDRAELLKMVGGAADRVERYVNCVTIEAANEIEVDDCTVELLEELGSRELEAALSKMPEQNRSILRWRFGIGCPSISLAACGQRMGVTAQRAQQIERRALRYLRYAPEATAVRAQLAASGVDWRSDPS